MHPVGRYRDIVVFEKLSYQLFYITHSCLFAFYTRTHFINVSFWFFTPNSSKRCWCFAKL